MYFGYQKFKYVYLILFQTKVELKFITLVHFIIEQAWAFILK